MSTTITFRADEALRDALAERAARSGKTVSSLVREILEQAVAARAVAARAGRLRGALTLAEPTDPWQRRLRERNWRD